MSGMSSQIRAGLEDSLAKEVRKFIAGSILFNENVAASAGLNGRDLQFLHVLQLQETVTPKDLARWSCLSSGGVTVVLDRLEKAGYIRREPNPADRRSVVIRASPARLRKLAAAYRSKGDLLAQAMAAYSEAELKTILDFFQRTNQASLDGNASRSTSLASSAMR